VGLWFGTLIALFLLIAPGAIIARITQLSWPVAVAVGPALTYGVVALAIIPFGAIGIPWNGWTALAALVVVCLLMIGLQLLLARYRDRDAEARAVSRWPAITVSAGVALGALLVMWAAYRGLAAHWQTIPSTWDAVWHANEVRFILDTGQASSTHMGELRNVETHKTLYYPSVFHALTAVFCQLTGAAPTTGYTLSSVAASVWLFPTSAAMLTWHLLRPRTTEWRCAGAAATAAALSASFTAVPYVEFGVAAMPNLAAYGVAVPAFVLIASTLRHRDRIPAAVLAWVGVMSVHITGGVIVLLFLVAWWVLDVVWHPVRGRLVDFAVLACVAVLSGLILLPQFISVQGQEDIIAGHSFLTHLSKKRGVFDMVFQHSRHLNDFPVQYGLIAVTAIGGVIFLVKKIWWPLALWLLLVVVGVDAGNPLGGPVGALAGMFGEFFYKDPRRISAAITLLLEPMAGVALFAIVVGVVAGIRRVTGRFRPLPAPVWVSVTAVLLVAATVLTGRHYLYRHLVLMGDKYDSVMIDQRDLMAMAYLATLPGAHDTLIGNANTDGTAWMYAVADLHPLWTHYDYPQQMGPGPNRYIFWARARLGDSDPRVVEAIKALNIRYIYTSTPTVRGFAVPEGLVSLDKSKSWALIYDNGGARIYEWRGNGTTPHS
jgi:D-galactosaminyltransferase